MSKSKKGSKFEREFCNKLSLWWSEGKRDDLFWRTAGSGARATTRKKAGKSATRQQGDICAIDPLGEDFLKVFACELKRGYQKDTIQDLIDASEGAAKQVYQQWIEQAMASRDGSNALFWMVVCKRDRRKALVMFPLNFTLSLLHVGHSWRKTDDWIEFGGVVLTPLNNFLEQVTPEGIKTVLEKWPC